MIEGEPIGNVHGWEVDYGRGFTAVDVPHVWHLDTPVQWEGEAVYRTTLQVPNEEVSVLFEGVCYAATVLIDGIEVCCHRGIWDAFLVPLDAYKGKLVQLIVRVVKNGGTSFPVKDVASGFLPYVFHTFGGIFRPVRIVSGDFKLDRGAAPLWGEVQDGRVLVRGEPFYARGILTWGWYPENNSPHPNESTICAEIDRIQACGFNLVKFCLWLPPHFYLKELARRSMVAWIELPIWLPSTEAGHLKQMRSECLEVVRQYRHHPNVIAWTVGCELSDGIEPLWRKEFVEEIQDLTGCPLVKDNSGGAEMYGGHPSEFGTFEDFHPYCEPMFYPLVLDNLARGSRHKTPTFLGEFNDCDVFRPLQLWEGNEPYWASCNVELNAQGVRWQYDLPRILNLCRTTDLGAWLDEVVERAPRWTHLLESSRSQGVWMRQAAFDATRLRSDIDGWVLTGLCHTPISTAGVFDDAGECVYPKEVVRSWTTDIEILLLCRRTPPWIIGGNRPGWENPLVRFSGPSLIQIATHSVRDIQGVCRVEISGVGRKFDCNASVKALETSKILEFEVQLESGTYELVATFGETVRSFRIQVFDRDPDPSLHGFISPVRTLPRPFFRECCYSWDHPIWADHGLVDNWDFFAMIAGDQVIDPEWISQTYPQYQPLLTRLDTRTFERAPVAVIANNQIITTLRLGGGLGIQPTGIERNPGGQYLMRVLDKLVKA